MDTSFNCDRSMGTTKRDPTRDVWVTPYTGSPIKYAFVTNVNETDAGILGHKPSSGETGLLYGVNRPKPLKMSRRRNATDSTSSFCDAAAFAAAKTAGFKVSVKGYRPTTPFQSPRSVRVCVAIAPGIAMAWNMPRDTYTELQPDFGTLGIELVTNANRGDCVTGINKTDYTIYRAEKQIQNGDEVDRYSTFVAYTVADNDLGEYTLKSDSNRFADPAVGGQ